MTTDTEALRAQFEAWATAAYRLSFDDDTPLKRYLWAAYQAGHAAAMAETASTVQGVVHARSAVSSCNSYPERTSRSASAADTN